MALGQILGLFYFKMAFVHSLLYSCLDLIFPSKEKRNPLFPSKERKPYLVNLHSDFFLSIYMALRPQWSNLGIFFPPSSQNFGQSSIESHLGNPTGGFLELDLAIQVSFNMENISIMIPYLRLLFVAQLIMYGLVRESSSYSLHYLRSQQTRGVDVGFTCWRARVGAVIC